MDERKARLCFMFIACFMVGFLLFNSLYSQVTVLMRFEHASCLVTQGLTRGKVHVNVSVYENSGKFDNTILNPFNKTNSSDHPTSHAVIASKTGPLLDYFSSYVCDPIDCKLRTRTNLKANARFKPAHYYDCLYDPRYRLKIPGYGLKWVVFTPLYISAPLWIMFFMCIILCSVIGGLLIYENFQYQIRNFVDNLGVGCPSALKWKKFINKITLGRAYKDDVNDYELLERDSYDAPPELTNDAPPTYDDDIGNNDSDNDNML